jgi:NADH-quinone oxidoreductase subunit E
MTVATKINRPVADIVQEVISRHGATKDELIPILNEVNQILGYLPAEALHLVAAELRVPQSQLFSVASFYHMLSTKPRGRHVIQFCESAPCHVVGGRKVLQALQQELGLESGETSEDGKWSLIMTSCLGVCAVGPVLIINNDIFGNVTPSQIPEILARYH